MVNANAFARNDRFRRNNIYSRKSINYRMKLLQQILLDAGADTNRAFTVVPSFGGYFKSVKRVDEYTPEKIVLFVAKQRFTVTGNNLTIDKYYQQDLLIRGDISGVSIE